jgi:hypothetical protein
MYNAVKAFDMIYDNIDLQWKSKTYQPTQIPYNSALDAKGDYLEFYFDDVDISARDEAVSMVEVWIYPGVYANDISFDKNSITSIKIFGIKAEATPIGTNSVRIGDRNVDVLVWDDNDLILLSDETIDMWQPLVPRVIKNTLNDDPIRGFRVYFEGTKDSDNGGTYSVAVSNIIGYSTVAPKVGCVDKNGDTAVDVNGDIGLAKSY